MIGVVVSRADEASVAIGERLREIGEWEAATDDDRPDADGGGTYYRTATARPLELRTFESIHLSLEHPERAFSTEPDAIVFASRHSGDTGALLTCHPTGNFGPAEFGGDDRAFAPAAPGLQRELLAGFDEYAPDEYGVGVECTHHGPTATDVPAIFAEVGSSAEQWTDPGGVGAVARAIHRLGTGDATPRVGPTDEPRHVLGVGGGHYAPRFERVARETPWGVGHVASDWQLDELGDPAEEIDTLVRAADASDANLAVIAGEYPEVRAALEATDVRPVGERFVRAVGDRSLALVSELETRLSPVAEGLRFGERRTDAYDVRSLPAELTETAFGIDDGATARAVTANTVAYETTDGATQPAGRVAVPDDAAYDELVTALAGVLDERYDNVEREPTVVRATRQVFDPAAAQEAGVPEGPQFGRLADGESVEIDGRRIEPSEVHRTQTDEFPIPDG